MTYRYNNSLELAIRLILPWKCHNWSKTWFQADSFSKDLAWMGVRTDEWTIGRMNNLQINTRTVVEWLWQPFCNDQSLCSKLAVCWAQQSEYFWRCDNSLLQWSKSRSVRNVIEYQYILVLSLMFWQLHKTIW